jgi:hypothetical protein
MTTQHFSPTLRERRIELALVVFEIVVRATPQERLWFLHAALEKAKGATVVRGSWGELGSAACPLSALVLGRAPNGDLDAGEAERESEKLVRHHGFEARDFYGPWDQGMIRPWTLLRIVDREITRRVMGRDL